MQQLSAVDKNKVISEIQQKTNLKATDTGAIEVQVALITKRIEYLTEHLKRHSKDLHSQRGLKKLVNQRRQLLNYLKRKHADRYEKIMQLLEVRH